MGFITEKKTSNRSKSPVDKPEVNSISGADTAGEAALLSFLGDSYSHITPIIIVLNTLFFATLVLLGVSVVDPTIEDLITWGANFGPLTLNQEWWRLVSSTFLHIGFLHLAFNMWVLWHLGTLAERLFGSVAFSMLYVCCGIGGSIASLMWNPTVVSAGASGAVFGVAGGLAGFFLFGKLQIPESVVKENLASVLAFVGYNVVYGFGESGIDNAAHLGGLVTGFALGAVLQSPLSTGTSSARRRVFVAMPLAAISLVLAASLVSTRLDDFADRRDETGATSLMYAALEGQTDMVDGLINAGAEVDARDNEGWTPLMYGAQGGYTDTVQLLLDAGSNISIRVRGGGTALMVAASNGQHDAAQVLLDAGAEVDARDDDGWTPLMYAALAGQTDTVQMLFGAGAEVDARGNDGWTPMMLAAQEGHTDTVQILLDAGANIGFGNMGGGTALMVAASNGQHDAAQALLDAGAEVDARDNEGWTPLMYAAQEGEGGTLRALLDAGAEVNARRFESAGLTALMVGAFNGQADAVQILLDAGAEVDAADIDAGTAMMYAVQEGHADVVEILLDAGAEPLR